MNPTPNPNLNRAPTPRAGALTLTLTLTLTFHPSQVRELSAEEKAELYEACLPGGALQGAHARRASAMAAGRARAAAILAEAAEAAEAAAAEAALAATGANPNQVRCGGLTRTLTPTWPRP